MAMETEGLRSDFQTSMNKIKEYILKFWALFFKYFLHPIINRIEKATGRKIGKSYQMRKNQKKAVEKDGKTTQKTRISNLSYEEVAKLSQRAMDDNIPFYIVCSNGDEMKSYNEVQKLTKAYNDFQQAKSEFADNQTAVDDYNKELDNARNSALKQKKNTAVELARSTGKELSKDELGAIYLDNDEEEQIIKNVREKNKYTKTIDKCQKNYEYEKKKIDKGFSQRKYDALVQSKLNEKYGIKLAHDTIIQYSEDNLTDKEKLECFEKACSGKPFSFTFVANISREMWCKQQEREIANDRAIAKENEINNRLDPTKSDVIKEMLTEYDTSVINEEKFKEMCSSAKEELKHDLTDAQIKEYRELCTYGQNILDFQNTAKENKSGYSVFTYGLTEGKEICAEIDKSNIDYWSCGQRSNNEGEFIDIYINDDDIDKYNYNRAVPTQHFSSLPSETISQDLQELNSSLDTVTLSMSEYTYAREVFEDKDYSAVFKNDEVTLVFKRHLTVNELKTKKEQIQEKHNRSPLEAQKKEVILRERKKCMSIIKDNINFAPSIIDNLKLEANKENNDAKELLKINDILVKANGGKELSEEQWRKFNPDELRVNGEYDKFLINELANKIKTENKSIEGSTQRVTSSAPDEKSDTEKVLADNEINVFNDIDLEFSDEK